MLERVLLLGFNNNKFISKPMTSSKVLIRTRAFNLLDFRIIKLKSFSTIGHVTTNN